MAATRRRGAELDAAIFDAVLTELRDVGFADLTVEGVARRAGTSKAVLYRRWSTKLEMVITALANTRLADISPPDTGTLAGDLRGTILELLDRLAAQGREVALGIMAGAASEPNPAAMTVLRTKAEDLSGVIIRRARDRGEIGAGPVPATAATLAFDLVRYRFLVEGSLSAEAIDDVVETAAVPLIRVHASGAEDSGAEGSGPKGSGAG